MKSFVLCACLSGWVLSSAAYGAGALSAMLTTIYDGDHKRASKELSDLQENYQAFLLRFIADAYCQNDAYGSAVRKGCQEVIARETALIAAGYWSRYFRFGAADFYRSFGTYNLEKKVKVTDSYSCRFTLQLTADLERDRLLSREYSAECR